MAHNQKPLEDLRVRRTRKLLQQAMIDLTIAKGFAEVTVQEIAEWAMVNRATFYRHYLDKYDLLEQYMNEVYELTGSQIAMQIGRTQGEAADSPPIGMVRMLEHIQRHADFYRVMLGKQGDPAFMQRIQQYIEQRIRSVLPADLAQVNPRNPPLELCLRSLSYAGVGGIVWWLTDPQAHSPTEMAVWLNQLSQATMAVALRQNP